MTDTPRNLIGGHTDVCAHDTSVDAHQHDSFTRVIEDCVARSSLDTTGVRCER